jgi:hypothetical protein
MDVKTRISIKFSVLIFIYLFSAKQSYFWEVNSRSVSKQIPHLLWNYNITAASSRFQIIRLYFHHLRMHNLCQSDMFRSQGHEEWRSNAASFPQFYITQMVLNLILKKHILQHFNTYANRNTLRHVRALLRWSHCIIHRGPHILLPFTTVICNMMLRKPTMSALEKSTD